MMILFLIIVSIFWYVFFWLDGVLFVCNFFYLVDDFVVLDFLDGCVGYGGVCCCVVLVFFVWCKLDYVVNLDFFDWFILVLNVVNVWGYDECLVEWMCMLGCVCVRLKCYVCVLNMVFVVWVEEYFDLNWVSELIVWVGIGCVGFCMNDFYGMCFFFIVLCVGKVSKNVLFD